MDLQGTRLQANPETCIFCQRQPSDTRDHVPPESWFPRPRPSNMVTVPACTACNGSWAADAEYFRAILVASASLHSSKPANEVRSTVARSFRRPESQKLAKSILGAFVDLDVTSTGGIHLGKGIGLRYERQRVLGVLRQIVRGIFFEESGTALPGNCQVRVNLDQLGQVIPNWMQAQFGNPLPDADRNVGDIFEYWVRPRAQGVFESLWAGRFFRRVYFCAYVSDPQQTSPAAS